MEWLNQHAELGILLCTLAGSAATFAGWNIGQGYRIKSLEKMVGAHEDEIKVLRSDQGQIVNKLMDELRAISVKLAHIEGFLTAQKRVPGRADG